MTDKLINDLDAIVGALSDDTETEVQRNGQAGSEKAALSDWKTWINSWVAGGGPAFPAIAVNNVYVSNAGVGNITGSAVTALRQYMVPVYLIAGMSLTTLAVVVSGVGAGGTTGKLALYNASQLTGQPLTVLAAGGGGNFAVDSTGTKTQTISVTITKSGWYYLAFISDGAPTVQTASTIAGNAGGMVLSGTSATIVVGVQRSGLTYANAFADETGNTFSAVLAGTLMPILGVK